MALMGEFRRPSFGKWFYDVTLLRVQKTWW